MIDQPPESLVRGCNDPVSIGVLSDWIEEQYGIALDLDRSGWDDTFIYCFGVVSLNNDYLSDNYGNGYGFGFGHYDGCGHGNGNNENYGFWWNGNGVGYGYRVNGNGYSVGYLRN